MIHSVQRGEKVERLNNKAPRNPSFSPIKGHWMGLAKLKLFAPINKDTGRRKRKQIMNRET